MLQVHLDDEDGVDEDDDRLVVHWYDGARHGEHAVKGRVLLDDARDRNAGVFEHGGHVVAASQLHERERQKRDAHKDGNKL